MFRGVEGFRRGFKGFCTFFRVFIGLVSGLGVGLRA